MLFTQHESGKQPNLYKASIILAQHQCIQDTYSVFQFKLQFWLPPSLDVCYSGWSCMILSYDLAQNIQSIIIHRLIGKRNAMRFCSISVLAEILALIFNPVHFDSTVHSTTTVPFSSQTQQFFRKHLPFHPPHRNLPLHWPLFRETSLRQVLWESKVTACVNSLTESLDKEHSALLQKLVVRFGVAHRNGQQIRFAFVPWPVFKISQLSFSHNAENSVQSYKPNKLSIA